VGWDAGWWLFSPNALFGFREEKKERQIGFVVNSHHNASARLVGK